jgi:hypothetical protein
MALLNVVTIYSHWWQGNAITTVEKGGWGLTVPQALGIDVGLGLIFLLVLPLLPSRPPQPAPGMMDS